MVVVLHKLLYRRMMVLEVYWQGSLRLNVVIHKM